MEYKVPQNIDIEDKVVGPLTLRQFIIILIGVGLIIVLNFALYGPIRFFFYLFSMIIIAGALGLAFFDYGGQHLEKIIIDAIGSYINPRKMVWKREAEKIEQTEPNKREETPRAVKRESLEQIQEKLKNAARVSDKSNFDYPGAPDPIMEKNSFLDSTINSTVNSKKDAEPLLSQLASVSPKQNFDNPQIEIKRRRRN